MWVTPDSGRTVCGRPAASRAEDRRSVWATLTLSSASPCTSISGREHGRVRDEGAAVVRLRILVGVPEVALLVVGVVKPLVGDRRAGDGDVEDIGPAQDGKRGEVAAKGPTPYANPGQVQVAVVLRRSVQCVHLVLQDRGADVTADGAFPGRAAPRRSATVGDDDGEALLGKPLGDQVAVAGGH